MSTFTLMASCDAIVSTYHLLIDYYQNKTFSYIN